MPITLPAFLNRAQITGQVRSMDVPANFIYGTWFPIQGVPADEFESLIVLDQMHLAPFVAVDAETPSMADDIWGVGKWQVAYMRFKKRFKESDLRVFAEPGISDPNTLAATNARAAEAKIRRYIDLLSMSIDARLEWLFANALNGSIAYDDTNVQYSVTYGGAFIGTLRKVPTTTWENTNATIVADLSNWIEAVSDESNHDSWTLVASRRVLGHMARNSQVTGLWATALSTAANATGPTSINPANPGAGSTSASANAQQVQRAMELIGITNVISYNTRYTTTTGSAFGVTRTRTRFTDDRDIFLLPTGMPLGRMATAPAEANNWQTGKFGWRKQMEDPWVTEVGAGMYTWIDWPATNWNKVLQARVL